MRKNTKHVSAEIILIIASVLIFRSLWMLLDMIAFMHDNLTLWVSLIVGVAVSIPALRYIIRNS